MALFKVKPAETIDFETLIRPASPNTYLVCPPGFSAAEADQEAPIFDRPVQTLISAWHDLAAKLPRTQEIERSDDTMQRSYVQRTALMGYPDIITVLFFDLDGDRSTLAIYSRSQYGYSDMGANRRRVQTWLRDLSKALS